jgi:histone chaperone ASF1
LGVTVVLLTCAYQGQQFLRVGYYVNNEYATEAMQEDPPAVPVLGEIRRSILADKPRVTLFPIEWNAEVAAMADDPMDTNTMDSLDAMAV